MPLDRRRGRSFNPDWTEERIQFLRDNYRSMFTSKIAKEFGDLFTRNAIIGKARRLGLAADFRRYPGRRATPPRELRLTVIRPRSRITVREDTVAKIKEKALKQAPALQGTVTILELEGWHCREIVTEKPQPLYCGKQKWEGSSYCIDHHVKNHTRVGNANVEKYYARA